MVNVKCENNIPLLWGSHRSVLWSSSEISQPCYLIIFCILLLHWGIYVNEQKINKYLKYAIAYGQTLSSDMFIIVKFLLAWVFAARNIYMRLCIYTISLVQYLILWWHWQIFSYCHINLSKATYHTPCFTGTPTIMSLYKGCIV